MDSGRDTRDDGYYGRGGGGNRRYRGGRRGGGGYRGGGGGQHHQPYGGRRRGGVGGGAGPRNRFGVDAQQPQDPQAILIRQACSMVSRVGEFKNLKTDATGNASNDATTTTDALSQIISLRPVEATTARNMNDLVPVLCAPDKLEVFFKFTKAGPTATTTTTTTTKQPPDYNIGKLGHLVVGCAAGLPLQTPCYAALTLAIHEQVRLQPPYGGFAARCVDHACVHLGRDLDAILLLQQAPVGTTNNNHSSPVLQLVAQAACRIKLLLRYLALLGKMGVVQAFPQEEGDDASRDKVTLLGLLSNMLEAAKVASAEPHNNPGATYLLVNLVLSTLPYLLGTIPQDQVDERLVGPAQEICQAYTSTFRPGTGKTAVLLKGEQDDGGDQEEEDDEEEEEDDDDEGAGPICDSLQDLMRISQRLKDPTRFALPVDAPWRGLTQSSTPNPESGETETRPVTFSDEASYLSLGHCQSLKLLSTEASSNNGDEINKSALAPVSLEGVVFGRLPIFGSPRDPNEEDDDDDEEEMEDEADKNEQLAAFREKFSLSDRFFVGDTMRDCLLSHESFVTPTGLQLGSAKSVAEELMSVTHVFTGENPSQGMEYAIVETVFSLIAQSREGSALKCAFLSQVLLELVKLNPALFSRPLLVAVTNLFQDYLPALVPSARENFSQWLAFHLINTDYQWPKAFWKIWEPHATSPDASSRGDFVRQALHLMVESLSEPKNLLEGCLSETKSLSSEFFPRSGHPSAILQEEDPHFKLEEEVYRRVWEVREDPNDLLPFLESYEVKELARNGVVLGDAWARERILARVLCSPIKKLHDSLKDSLQVAGNDDQMEDDSYQSADPYSSVLNVLAQYGKTMDGMLRNENHAPGGLDEGRALVLQEVEGIAYFNESILRGIVCTMLKHEIVNGMAVLRWALGDVVLSRWWIYAIDALQHSTNPSTDAEGMVVDGNQAESAARTARNELLQFAVNRIRPLLATKTEKRLDPIQVNLVEGMKTVAVRADAMNKKTSLEDDGSIPALADLCVGSESSPAIDILKRSLSNI